MKLLAKFRKKFFTLQWKQKSFWYISLSNKICNETQFTLKYILYLKDMHMIETCFSVHSIFKMDNFVIL